MNSTTRISVLATAAFIAMGGSALAQQAPQAPNMTFFVTSIGPGKGADLGGIDGADAYCQRLGTAAGAAVTGVGMTGTSQLVVDDSRQVVVGATITGFGVAELLHSATIAIAGEVPLPVLWHAVPSFPTVSEVWLHLLEAYGL